MSEYFKIRTKENGKKEKNIFGTWYPEELPDIMGELAVLNKLFPDRKNPTRLIKIDKSIEIIKHLYDRYYPGYLWSNYEESYVRTTLETINNFTSGKKGSAYQFMSLVGPSNVGKTTKGTALYCIFYLMNPMETKIILTSNKIDSTYQRIWSDFLKRFNDIKRNYPEIYKDSDWIVNNLSLIHI